MSKYAKVLKIAGVIAGVALIAIVVSWLGNRGSDGKTVAPAGSETPLEYKPAGSAPLVDKSKPMAGIVTVAGAKPSPTPPQAASTNQAAGWEDKVDEILTSSGADPDKARQMLEMFARLPEEGKVEVAQHLSNLVPDEDYGSLRKLLTDAAQPDTVLDVLLADTLNRPNSLKLPSLLEVARDPQNPKAAEAKDLLQLYLDEDYGNDWNTWQTKMEAWLKDNPD